MLTAACRCPAAAHVSADGTRCEARDHLELDHLTPWSLGGRHEADNLVVARRGHNRYRAEQWFGRETIEAKIAHARLARLESRPGLARAPINTRVGSDGLPYSPPTAAIPSDTGIFVTYAADSWVGA